MLMLGNSRPSFLRPASPCTQLCRVHPLRPRTSSYSGTRPCRRSSWEQGLAFTFARCR